MELGAGLTVSERLPGFLQTACGWLCVGSGSLAIMQSVTSDHILGVGAFIAGLGLVLYLSARIQICAVERGQTAGPVTGVFRGLPREDVRGHGRDIRGARCVRLDSNTEFWPVTRSSSIWGSAS